MLDKFNPKVSAIEELNDLKTLSIDQLLGTLTAYEMRINKDKSITREASFKAEKNIDSKLNDIEAKFVRRLKRGSGRYQGKLSFKWFKCGKIGHVESKCPIRKMTRTLMMKRSTNPRNIVRRKVCVQIMTIPHKT